MNLQGKGLSARLPALSPLRVKTHGVKGKRRPRARLAVEALGLLVAVAALLTSMARMNNWGGATGTRGSLQWPSSSQVHLGPADRMLTRELLASVAINNTVVIAIANYDHRDFALNWAYHLRMTNMSNYLLGATEVSLVEYLDSVGVPAYFVNLTLPQEALELRSAAFNEMVRYKAQLAVDVTGMGFDLLFSDVDAIILRNPLPFFDMYPEADVLCSSDNAYPTVNGSELENWRISLSHQLNIGFTFYRTSSHRFTQAWLERLYEGEIGDTWVQGSFNSLLKRNATSLPGNTRNVFSAWQGNVTMGVLPVLRFCSGYLYFVKPVPEPAEVYMVHATKVRSHAKRHRLREAGMWHDDPSYFRHEPGFLSLDLFVPVLLRMRAARLGAYDNQAQVDMTNFQLKQVKHMFAFAVLTERAAIIPRFTSRVDCVSAPNTVRRLLRGPADQVINIEKLATLLPEDTYGKEIEYREASFLKNPQADYLLDSIATIEFCQQGEVDASCSNKSTGLKWVDGKALVQADLSYEEIGDLLKPITAKVVHLVGLANVVGDFGDAETRYKFRRRMEEYASECCCNVWESEFAGPTRRSYSFFDTDGREEQLKSAIQPMKYLDVLRRRAAITTHTVRQAARPILRGPLLRVLKRPEAEGSHAKLPAGVQQEQIE